MTGVVFAGAMHPARAIPFARVSISTERYERSHGKRPRGEGLWLFETRSGRVVVEVNASYGVARDHAQRQASIAGLDLLFVCP